MRTSVRESDLLSVAEQAARAAAGGLREHIENGFSVREKTESFDRVTSADLEAESIITRVIRESFPDHTILAEEGSYPETSSPYRWIIDPIDGTTNFIKAVPHYSISIAVQREDELLAGVVYDPSLDEMFSAVRGQGAWLNGSRISVSKSDSFRDALLITGFYYNRGTAMVECLETIKNFFAEGILGIRRFGSAALDLCYIACGRADGYWEYRLSPWDYAAGSLICREAGGRTSRLDGSPLSLSNEFIVASNGILHESMLEIINRPKQWSGEGTA